MSKNLKNNVLLTAYNDEDRLCQGLCKAEMDSQAKNLGRKMFKKW